MREIKIIAAVLIAAIVVLMMAGIAYRIAGAVYPTGVLSTDPDREAFNIHSAVKIVAFLTAIAIVLSVLVGVLTKKISRAIVVALCSLAGLLFFEVITIYSGGFGLVLAGSIIGAALGSGLLVGYATAEEE